MGDKGRVIRGEKGLWAVLRAGVPLLLVVVWLAVASPAEAIHDGVGIEPSSVGVGPGGSVTVDLVAEAPEFGLTLWAVDVGFDPTVITTQPTKCFPLASPAGSAAFFTTCAVVDGAVQVLGVILLTGGELSGDVNCSGAVKPSDAQMILQHDAGLIVAAPAGCPNTGGGIMINGEEAVVLWGDVNCSGAVKPSDAQMILQHDAGLIVAPPPGCPIIGGEVQIVRGLQGEVILARITFDAVGLVGECSTLEVGQGLGLFVDVEGSESAPAAANGEICIE